MSSFKPIDNGGLIGATRHPYERSAMEYGEPLSTMTFIIGEGWPRWILATLKHLGGWVIGYDGCECVYTLLDGLPF